MTLRQLKAQVRMWAAWLGPSCGAVFEGPLPASSCCRCWESMPYRCSICSRHTWAPSFDRAVMGVESLRAYNGSAVSSSSECYADTKRKTCRQTTAFTLLHLPGMSWLWQGRGEQGTPCEAICSLAVQRILCCPIHLEDKQSRVQRMCDCKGSGASHA